VNLEKPNRHEIDTALDYLDRNIRYLCARVRVKEEYTLPKRPVHNLKLVVEVGFLLICLLLIGSYSFVRPQSLVRMKGIAPENAPDADLEQSLILTAAETPLGEFIVDRVGYWRLELTGNSKNSNSCRVACFNL